MVLRIIQAKSLETEIDYDKKYLKVSAGLCIEFGAQLGIEAELQLNQISRQLLSWQCRGEASLHQLLTDVTLK